jgi:hypothetical protein
LLTHPASGMVEDHVQEEQSCFQIAEWLAEIVDEAAKDLVRRDGHDAIEEQGSV